MNGLKHHFFYLIIDRRRETKFTKSTLFHYISTLHYEYDFTNALEADIKPRNEVNSPLCMVAGSDQFKLSKV